MKEIFLSLKSMVLLLKDEVVLLLKEAAPLDGIVDVTLNVTLPVALLIVFFLIFQIFFLKRPLRQLLILLRGVGFAFSTLEEVLKEAEPSATFTHHPEGIKLQLPWAVAVSFHPVTSPNLLPIL